MELGISYFGNRILRHFRRDLEDIRARHFTYVVHTFSENDQVFYKQDTMATNTVTISPPIATRMARPGCNAPST